MIDWKSRLREGMRGIAVEGKDDKLVLEAFLRSGENAGLWQNWQTKLIIVVAAGFQNVLAELSADQKQFDIWAVLDREWRPDTEIQEMQSRYPNLRFLPRRMIENYAIDPNELWRLLSAFQQNKLDQAVFRKHIESNVEAWITHGALLYTIYGPSLSFLQQMNHSLYELIGSRLPPVNDKEIVEFLERWHQQSDPEPILANYTQARSGFNAMSQPDKYRLCIEGKMFFTQVICPILNNKLGQKNSDKWLETLFKPTEGFSAPCPDDLKDLLVELVG